MLICWPRRWSAGRGAGRAAWAVHFKAKMMLRTWPEYPGVRMHHSDADRRVMDVVDHDAELHPDWVRDDLGQRDVGAPELTGALPHRNARQPSSQDTDR